jgi:ubiquinone/menaquinone biosynthesis C-methylase UbiE
MFKWFKPSTLDPLSVSMAGVKLADRVLVLGCSDPRFIAALAAKSGLTGRTLAIDERPGLAERAERVALAEGALIESATSPLTSLPLPDADFDLVVLRDVIKGIDRGRQSAVLSEAQRVLRPGGRCMVIDAAPRAGLFGGQSAGPAGDDVAAALTQVGFVAVRTLAEREGLLFIEAIKRNA